LALIGFSYCPDFNPGPQTADIFGGGNYCDLLLFLNTKHVFENFGGSDCPVAPLVADLLQPKLGDAPECDIDSMLELRCERLCRRE